MAKLPTVLQTKPTDFPQLVGIARLLTPLIKFTQDVSRLFDKQLTVQDNLDGAVLTVIVDGQYPVDMMWNRPQPPTMIMIGQCLESTGLHTIFTDPVSLDWIYTSAGKVRINNVPGIVPTKTKTYTLTLLALVG